MWVLGHAVVGPRLVQVVRPRLLLGWLVFGGLLPDLIDKPLYYALVYATGRRGEALGLISGTRTFGHTGLLCVGVAVAAMLLGRAGRVTGSARLAAVAWGMWSHVALDNVGDLLGRLSAPPEGPTALDALLFPLLGARFPVSPFQSVREHLLSVGRLYPLLGEVAGLLLLIAGWLRRRGS